MVVRFFCNCPGWSFYQVIQFNDKKCSLGSLGMAAITQLDNSFKVSHQQSEHVNKTWHLDISQCTSDTYVFFNLKGLILIRWGSSHFSPGLLLFTFSRTFAFHFHWSGAAVPGRCRGWPEQGGRLHGQRRVGKEPGGARAYCVPARGHAEVNQLKHQNKEK